MLLKIWSEPQVKHLIPEILAFFVSLYQGQERRYEQKKILHVSVISQTSYEK